MKQGILLLVLLFSACTFIYDEDEFIYTQPQITVETSLSNPFEGTLFIITWIINAENLKVDRIGHCYIFDSEIIPDTSSLMADGISLDTLAIYPVYYGSVINYTEQNKYIYVRGFIQFSDSILYSDIQFKSLNE